MKVQDRLDKIADKHTKAVTKKDGITDFDVILVDIYELKKDVLALISSEVTAGKREAIQEVLRILPKQFKTYDDFDSRSAYARQGYNKALKDTRSKLKSLDK